MSRKVVIPNINDLIRRYKAGETIQKLAPQVPISRISLTRRFKKLGVTLRGPHEAQLLSNTFKTSTQRKAQARAAQNAVRGSKRSKEYLIARAKRNQKFLNNVSVYETAFRKELEKR